MPRGKIVAYSSIVSAGVIESKRGKFYFLKSQWFCNKTEPQNNLDVIFDESPDGAMNVRSLPPNKL